MKNYKVYGILPDEKTKEQIEMVAKSTAFKDEKIAIMPDTHFGKGAPIGFTSTYSDKIVPNLVGVDIGCGMTFYKLEQKIDLQKLQNIIRKRIPYGSNANTIEEYITENKARCKNDIKLDNLSFELRGLQHVINSLGSLGGGNHFIEIDEDKKGVQYLVIHSGSRSLGAQVALRHQKIALKNQNKKVIKISLDNIKPEDREKYIKEVKIKNDALIEHDGLEFLEGKFKDDYLNDMKITQRYAFLNRELMIKRILESLEITFKKENISNTTHNYIDIENKIIRKGAIKVASNQLDLIPLNMRDGALIVRGKDNAQANYSAPHGAGRLMSRTQANNEVNLDEFKEAMKDVTSWTVNENTLDEAPFAYKTKDYILEHITELVSVVSILKPIFNFKDDSPKRVYGKNKKTMSKK